MTENEIKAAERPPEEAARLRLEPPDSFHDGWQWSGHARVVSLLGDGSVEIETGAGRYEYMRHPAPGRLDPDPEALADVRKMLARVNAGDIDEVPLDRYSSDVEWLLRELDKAVARDRQPYPTRQAYERTAEVLHFYRGKVQRVREYLFNLKSQPTITELRQVLDGDGVVPPPSKNSMGLAPRQEEQR